MIHFIQRSFFVLFFLFMASFVATSLGTPYVHAQTDQTTQFRVYQYDQLLSEHANRQEAIAKAKGYLGSYVEQISTRDWVFHQFPAYAVYQRDRLIGLYLAEGAAIREARKWAYSSVRHLERPGWIWDQYPRSPRYQVFQGEKSLPDWTFARIEDAKREAAKWANAYIVDFSTTSLIWDNVSAERKTLERAKDAKYKLEPDNGKTYSFIQDAMTAALQAPASSIIDIGKERKVYEHQAPYTVFQNSKPIASFHLLEDAINDAKRWANAHIETDGKAIWDNKPFYHVHIDNETIGHYQALDEAMAAARKHHQAVVQNELGRTIWDNSNELQFWAWTGSASDQHIQTWVTRTAGLDVISPTWFQLESSNGVVKDTSSAALVKWLEERGLEIHPLIHNQFNAEMTTAFLQDPKAQDTFISAIVNRAAALGVQGLNLDFEAMAGTDRQAYTSFVKKFTAKAHAQGLIVSIDLPRGSIAWNHLSAYDHEALASIVDYIVTMAYDQHYQGSQTPGSVSGLDWAENGIKEFLSYGIPRDQLILGIPFYIREWQLAQDGELVGNRALYAGDVDALLKDREYTTVWDPVFSQYRIEYEEDDYVYRFWLEDHRTVQARLELAKEYRLAGIAAWRLGQEAASMWQAIIENKY